MAHLGKSMSQQNVQYFFNTFFYEGCGKTMLMDLFYDEVPVEKKQRVHFHSFMLDVHSSM